IYEPNQESIEKNLEEDKMEDQEIGAKRRTPKIFTCENCLISIDNSCKNTLEDIPKELIESLKTELNRETEIETNSQITKADNIGNLEFGIRNADSAKKEESEINSSDKNECSRINTEKDDILYLNQKLKSIEDNRTNVQYDPGISR
ncbi:25787_t:CDS:2, partial [Gigaspora rosea]